MFVRRLGPDQPAASGSHILATDSKPGNENVVASASAHFLLVFCPRFA